MMAARVGGVIPTAANACGSAPLAIGHCAAKVPEAPETVTLVTIELVTYRRLQHAALYCILLVVSHAQVTFVCLRQLLYEAPTSSHRVCTS